MSTARLLNRYVWFVTTIYNRGPISLADIQHRYESHFGLGEELSERTFHRYKEVVMELFDIDIKFDRMQRGYVVVDRDDLNAMGMRKWLLQTFSVGGILHENQDLKGRILLEDVPSGQHFLMPIVDAMREGVVVKITYHPFSRSHPYIFEVEPWCVKLFEQRWYVLGMSDKLRIYALDRIMSLEPADRKFKLPKAFDAEKFFEDYYGVIINDEEFDVESVALKVSALQSKYLRTLPLHHSQTEVESTDAYSIFEYRLCPTFDFRQKLLSLGETVEVLAPQALRDEIDEKACDMTSIYHDHFNPPRYRFKVYKW